MLPEWCSSICLTVVTVLWSFRYLILIWNKCSTTLQGCASLSHCLRSFFDTDTLCGIWVDVKISNSTYDWIVPHLPDTYISHLGCTVCPCTFFNDLSVFLQMFWQVKTWLICLNNLGYLSTVISTFPLALAFSLRPEALGKTAELSSAEIHIEDKALVVPSNSCSGIFAFNSSSLHLNFVQWLFVKMHTVICMVL